MLKKCSKKNYTAKEKHAFNWKKNKNNLWQTKPNDFFLCNRFLAAILSFTFDFYVGMHRHGSDRFYRFSKRIAIIGFYLQHCNTGLSFKMLEFLKIAPKKKANFTRLLGW